MGKEDDYIAYCFPTRGESKKYLRRSGVQEGEARKHFTISSSPTEREFIEFTKKLTGHRFSNASNALKAGDWVKIAGLYFTFEGEFEKIGILFRGHLNNASKEHA